MAEKVKTEEQENVATMINEDLVARLKALFVIAENKRRKKDWRWYLDINFVRGNQYVQYNKATHKIELPPNPTGKPRVMINLTYAILRAVRRFVTEFKPRWEIGPYGLFKGDPSKGEDNKKYKDMVEKTSDYADFMYGNVRLADGKKGLARPQKEWIWDGLLTSVGYPMVYYDPETEEITVDTRDPFDVYQMDPQMHLQTNPLIWLVSQKYVSAIKENDQYENTENLKADNKVTQSQVKQMLHTDKYSSDQGGEVQDDFVSTVLVKEAHMLIKITDENLKKIRTMGYGQETIGMLEKAHEKNEKRVRVVSYTEGNPLPIRDEFIDDDEYSITNYSADVSSRETLSEGWVKNLRPLNLIINRTESGALAWMNAGLKYKLTMERGGGPSEITTEHGEILEYDMGRRPPTQLRQDPLPSAYYNKPDQYWRYMQTIGGSHDQFLGQGAGAGESGRHVEAIRAGDAQNLADLRDNNEDVMIWIMNRILKLTNKHYVNKKLIEIKDSAGNIKRFYVRGQEAGEKIEAEEEDGTLIIGPENSVKVDIGSWLAQTLNARKDFLLELYDRQILPREDTLENIEYGDIPGALRRVEKEIASGDIRSIGGRAGGAGAVPQPGQPQGPTPNQSMQAAEVENEAMMNGQMVPPTPPKLLSAEHIEIHEVLAQTQDLPGETVGLLAAHLEEDKKNFGSPAQSGAPPNPPVGPTAGPQQPIGPTAGPISQ